MDEKKLAVIFPGIGYTKDKPLLYYASRLLRSLGYEILSMEYHDLPGKIQGDRAMMKKAAEIAYEQVCEQFSDVAFSEYEDVVFVGKSIGTVVAAVYGREHDMHCRQVWYTPVEATFSFGHTNVIAFLGDKDPWSDVNEDKRLAKEQGIELFMYPDCNHSLECADVDKNIEIMRDVMKKTAMWI